MTQDPFVQGFFASFGVAGVVLAVALVLGRTRRIRAHMVAVALFVVLFFVTIGFAEAVGRRYDFDPGARIVHLPIAIAGGLSMLGPIATGWRRWRGRGSLRAHHAAIAIFLLLFAAATGTG